VVIKNGSGLFDANRATPAATTALLRAMERDPSAGPEYLAQLSIGGVDGTLRHRFREWETTRAIRAKTGTLDAVAALSGYVLAPPGRAPVAFSVFVNGISGKVSAARTSMDRIVDAVAREVWKGVSPPPAAAP
jgi:D-alanyl-D-alanine carboxypeptidase/D-alanyl-D-alanine-endopeptidase (penicillin-binding protein 4)